MSVVLVRFTEYVTRKREVPDVYLLNPSLVSAVLPRRDYTTIRCDGAYYHVSGDVKSVLRELGFTTKEMYV